MNTHIYFEIQADEPTRAIRFYRELLGWEFQEVPGLPIPYWQIQTNVAPGGLLGRPANTPPPECGTNAFVCSFEVEDFDVAAEKVVETGGQVALPKFAVPGRCWQGYFVDTEGNTFGLFQPDAAAKETHSFSMNPTNYPPLIPSIAVRDAAAALSFYQSAFGAEERFRLIDPENGKIGHAEFTINGQLMMLAEEYPAFNKAPETLGGTTAKFALMVPSADAAYERAIAAGATPIRPPSDQFYGHRSACLRDPFGHEWMLQHVIESVTTEEMQRRWNEMTQPCSEK